RSYNLIVKVGQVNLRLAIDTGSADTWIVASSSKEAQAVKLPTYPLDLFSPTFVPVADNSTEFKFSFADSTGTHGFIARETFQLENFTVSQQAFGLIETTDLALGEGQDGVSGILGFGFPRLSTIAQKTADTTAPPIMERLAQEGLVEYPLFGLSATREGGTLSLGAIDISVVDDASAIEWHDVVPFGHFPTETEASIYLHWTVHLAGVQIGEKSVEVASTYAKIIGRQPLALFDVGTSGIFGPYPAVTQIFDGIPDSRMVADGVWAIPCETETLMHFNFGGKPFTLEPKDYIMGETTGNPGTCLAWPVALPPSSDGIDWQFGAPFLRTVYTVFSFGIDTREPPLLGLFSLADAAARQAALGTTSTSTTATSTASVARMSDNEEPTTSSGAFPLITTTLPNSLLDEPTLTTSPYLFATTDPLPTPGGSSGFGTSTYAPALRPLNATGIPGVALPVSTITTTNTQGETFTTTVPIPLPSLILGRPGAASPRHDAPKSLFALVLLASLFPY
ncbi:acid protease, partial [Auricularia subglabra TFB-10046 SS5]